MIFRNTGFDAEDQVAVDRLNAFMAEHPDHRMAVRLIIQRILGLGDYAVLHNMDEHTQTQAINGSERAQKDDQFKEDK